MADFNIKQHDTLPILSANLKNANGSAINLTTVSSVRFFMFDQNTRTEKVNAAATIVVASTGGVSYTWVAGDTDTISRYYAEFELTYSGGGILTVPTVGHINIQVFNDLGSAV